MRYKLYENSKNDVNNPVETVFLNRGILNWKEYISLNKSVIIPYEHLDNIVAAVDCFEVHFNNNDKIGILVDEDPDGYCSAAMMYLYIKEMNVDYDVEYILHNKSKAHGLSSDVIIPKDIKLLIIPDAGTNDAEQCKQLDIDIVVLDHHEREEDNNYAIIVNNQTSVAYENKNLCGAGIVYKFLQALDDRFWNDYADNYLDLCALANISDVMDIRSCETKYLIDVGLNNIRNKCLKSFVTAQDYSMNGKLNIHNVQWYITPILNGMIRIGSKEEKELLFKAFIENDEFFDYKTAKRKDKESEIIKESIYDRAVRLCKNAKSRQDKIKEKGVKSIIEVAEKNNSDDKVVMVDATELLDGGLSGVVAIKIAEIFNKPCILLNKHIEKKVVTESDGKSKVKERVVYGGSARNVDNSPIISFKDVINSSNAFNWGKGHANAFGINLDFDRKDDALNSLNNILKDIDYDSTYRCDFILNLNEISTKFITDLVFFENIIGQGIEEPRVAVENIKVTRDEFNIIGKNSDTIKFKIGDVEYVKFKCDDRNELFNWLNSCWNDGDGVTINIVGRPGINEYGGTKTMQVIIDDLIVTQKDETDEDDIW